MMTWCRVSVLLLFAAMIGGTAFVFAGVPLLPEQNDSAWYYVNVHYLLTGQFIWESMYPSFEGPCQYYPMGYSLVILLARGVQRLCGIDWILVVRLAQFCAFAASGYLTYAVARLLGCRHLTPVAALLGFLYFPLFNFSTFVMSENLAALLVLLTAFWFLKGLQQHKAAALYGSFLVAGYSILVKPILVLVLPVLLGTWLLHSWPTRSWRRGAGLMAVLLICPVGMSVANRLTFGSFRLASGSGWHLWNRVIFRDRSIPRHSEELARLARDLRGKGQRYLVGGCWWDVTAQLSRCGYSHEQAQHICGAIARDGLRENFWKYVGNTFVLSAQMLFEPMPIRHVYATYEDFFLYLALFGRERQHAPLVNELARQKAAYERGFWGDRPLRLYQAWAYGFWRVQRTGLLALVAWGFLLWACLTLARALWTRSRETWPALVLVWIVAVVIVGSCLMENPDYRYRIPVTPILIVGCCALVEQTCSWLARRLRTRRQVPGDRRRPAARRGASHPRVS